MTISRIIIRRRIPLIIVWIIVLIGVIPAITGYSHFLNYSTGSELSNGSESAIAQQILNEKLPDNSSLIVVFRGNTTMNISGPDAARLVINFQTKLSGLHIENYSGSTSVYTQYADFINSGLNRSARDEISDNYTDIKNAAIDVFKDPFAFYNLWLNDGFKNSSIAQDVSRAFVGQNSYGQKFQNAITNATGTPYERVETAIARSYSRSFYNNVAFNYLNISDYADENQIAKAEQSLFHLYGIQVSADVIVSVISSSNPGYYYVENYGLLGIPTFLSSAYMAKNISLVYVEFNTPSGKIIRNDETASELAYPAVNSLAESQFGYALITGNGAIAYETNAETQKAAFTFGLIFIFLAIAVLFAAFSWKSSILVIIFSGISLLLGYVSEYISGLLFHSVSYIVNYTLTAVILGISADYLLFIISRYRDEIRSGTEQQEALEKSVKTSGKSIIISGLTVAFSLLTFSFIPGYKAWGTSLFFAVIFTIILETTMLPAVVSFFGKKLFLKYGLKPVSDEDRKKSKFYKLAEKSISRKFMVIAIIAILGGAGAYAFFEVPTTYNFDTGLPHNLEGVKALNLIDQSFGSNELYPVYIIVNIEGKNATSTLEKVSYYLISLSWVNKAYGPYLNGTSYDKSVGYSSYIIGNDYAYYIVYSKYSPYSANSINAVSQLRDNKSLIVGGLTSTIIDESNQNHTIYTELEIFIVMAIAIIIGISFRSWKYPFISLTGVFFSVSWTTAILYLVSRYLLHESLIYLIPVILFIILFSLGNDYTVFIISRIRELQPAWDRDEAIKIGISVSGKVVTALGIILAVSLGALSFIPVAFLEQLGIAFVISLLIDTFIIRILYFPAMIAALFPEKK